MEMIAVSFPVEVRGGVAYVCDPHTGRTIGRCDASVAAQNWSLSDALTARSWRRFRIEAAGFDSNRTTCKTGWDKQVETMRLSWKCRLGYMRTRGSRPVRLHFAPSAYETWSVFINKELKKAVLDAVRFNSENRHWDTWTESVARNHNRTSFCGGRRASRQGSSNCKRDTSTAGKAGLSMRINRRDTDARDFLS